MPKWLLECKKVGNNPAGLLFNLTLGKTYEGKCVKLGGKVINHEIFDDIGKRILLSAKARREYFHSFRQPN